MMNERSAKARKKARRQTQEESLEAAIESLYHSNKGRLVALAKADTKEKSGTPEWQKNVALATNTAGAAAGPAAIWMAVRQAKGKRGGMPRQAVEAVESKTKPTTRTGRAARATGKLLRNPKAIAAGGAAAIGAQVANTSGDVIAARFLAEDKKKSKESAMSKSLSHKDKAVVAGATAATGTAGYFAGSMFDRPFGAPPRNKNKRMSARQAAQFGSAMGGRNMADMLAAGYKAKAKEAPRQLGRKAMRNKYGVALGLAAGTGGALSAFDTVKGTPVKKSIEQSVVSKSDPVSITGHGQSLVAKRNFNAEADRQRRLGLYTGAGLGAGLVMGDAARRRAPIKAVELKDGTKRKIVDLPRGKRGRLTLAALAAGSAASTVGGVAAYRRGISERNNAYL